VANTVQALFVGVAYLSAFFLGVAISVSGEVSSVCVPWRNVVGLVDAALGFEAATGTVFLRSRLFVPFNKLGFGVAFCVVNAFAVNGVLSKFAFLGRHVEPLFIRTIFTAIRVFGVGFKGRTYAIVGRRISTGGG
jgi:hypothetical protein